MNFDEKLKQLPNEPGVYFYKDESGKIIYVGKAAVLKNRVRQYFQKSRTRDTKTDLLVQDIAQIDWTVTDSEIDAMFLESEMIKRYKPKYNIELRDDKHYAYIRIDFKSDHPTVQIVRRPIDDGAEYFGPYVGPIRPALKLLRRIFPFDYKKSAAKRPTLDYHLGLSPGLEGEGKLEEYKANLRKLRMYLRGERVKMEQSLRVEMEKAAKAKDFEAAARKRDQLNALKNLKRQVIFSDKEKFDITNDQALNGLADLLELKGAPRRIEGYDISHMSGTDTVASMIVFTDGVPNKGEYRKFKMKIPGNDDFAHMNEAIKRRFSGENLRKWPKPDLLLIDGGKGQLGAALKALKELEVSVPAIGLAKRFETIIVPYFGARDSELATRDAAPRTTSYEPRTPDFKEVNLPLTSHIIKLLQRIRDESHRFAVSYHSVLKGKRQTASQLDDIPGIGQATRKKLLRTFGSLKKITEASEPELAKVIGKSKATTVKKYLSA